MALPASQGAVQRALSHAGLAARLDEVRYLVFGRALPAVLFGVLGWRVFVSFLGQVNSLPTPVRALDVFAGPLPAALYFLFCAIPVGIYLWRPRPRARDGRIIARAAGLTGTTMLLVVGAFPNPILFTPWTVIRDISAPLALGAFVLAVYGLLY